MKHVFSKRTTNKLQNIIKKVDKFNEELEQYKQTTGDYELPIIDTTCIDFDELLPYQYTPITNGFRVEADGITTDVTMQLDEDGEEYIDGWDNLPYDSLKDSIAYDKRRLAKGWRVWKSENPDAELEKDDEE